MARELILVNLQRCTGCWSCSVGCKMVNELADDEYRLTVKTLGSGQGIDHPQGVWPNLSMSWQPVWLKGCTSCAEEQTEHGPFCVYTCPSRALTCGEAAEAEAERLAGEGFELFEIPTWEGTRPNVRYAYRGASRPVPGDWPSYPIVEAEFVEDEGDEGFTIDGTLIGELFENEATAAVLAEFIPWLDPASPESAMAKGMTLTAMAPFSQGLLDEDTLAAIAAEFAKLSPAPRFTVDGSLIGEIFENEAGAAILAKHVPWLDPTAPEGAMAKGMTLVGMAPYSQGLLDEETLAAIAADFEALAEASAETPGAEAEATAKAEPSGSGVARPAGGYTLKTKIRDLEKDPEAFAILAEHMPGFEIGSKEARQAGTMSIQMMSKFAGEYLTPEALADIERRLAALGGSEGVAAEEKPRKKGLFGKLFG